MVREFYVVSGAVTVLGGTGVNRVTHWSATKWDTVANAHARVMAQVEHAERAGAQLAMPPLVVTLPKSLPSDVREMLKEADNGDTTHAWVIPLLDSYLREALPA